MRIDLQHDKEIPAGRQLLEQLVGAHMVAHDEEELLHMVGVSISELSEHSSDHSLRLLMHAVYRAQSIIVDLLDLSTRQAIALEEGGAGEASDISRESEDFRRQQLDIWTRLRDDQL